jgi:hypothetical protein
MHSPAGRALAKGGGPDKQPGNGAGKREPGVTAKCSTSPAGRNARAAGKPNIRAAPGLHGPASRWDTVHNTGATNHPGQHSWHGAEFRRGRAGRDGVFAAMLGRLLGGFHL